MITFIGGFLTVLGLILIGVAQLLSGPGVSASDQAAAPILTTIGVGLAALGVIIFVVGLVTGRKARAVAARIAESGVVAQAVVTFVDRNYKILVNQQPIYSIVEVKFQDMSGTEHVFQHTTVDSELVIRNQVEVGSTVNVKYLPEDPSQNILMLADPRATT